MLVPIGHNNFIMDSHVLTVLKADSSSVRRLRAAAREKDMLIDATCGHRTRAVIVAVSGQVVLSAIQTDTLEKRFNSDEG